ncbi:MAG: indolepyruvate oxidoreductase subunit beta [Myxococcota bacterium]
MNQATAKWSESAAAPESATGRLKLLLVGVGGQGVLTAAKILGAAAHEAGQSVVVSQHHDMTQRGGNVECSVLFGPGRSSFIIGGVADILVGFEPLEVLRALPSIGANTDVVVNLGTVVPFEVTRSMTEYPPVDQILSAVRSATDRLTTVDGPTLMQDVGVARTLNVLMLGAVAGLGLLPFDEDQLCSAVERRSPARYQDANRRAFEVGLRWAVER